LHSIHEINQKTKQTDGYQSRLSYRAATFGTMTLCLLAVMLLLLAPSCFAQGSTSVLGGKVFDMQNKVIQNAVVTVTSDDTGLHWTAKTNIAGDWRVDALLAGHYHFEVAFPGFEKLKYPSFALEMADQKFIDVALVVGAATSSITVEASEEPLLETTAGVSGTILATKDLDELPTLSNSANEYGMLTPGVVYAGVSNPQGVYLWSNTNMSGFTTNAAGSGTNAMNYVMDGATDVIASSGNMAFIPALDSVQEMRFTTNAYDASISRTAAGTVNIMLKAGGKDFHGGLYEINKNNFANANYYGYGALHEGVPAVRHNEFGGTFGGPVWIPKLYNGRNKGTFFFFSYDAIRDISPFATGMMNVPTAQERTGDFSASYVTQTVGGVTTSYPVQLFDPATGAAGNGVRTPIKGENLNNSINGISPMAKALMALVPLPNKSSDGASTDSNNFLINDVQDDKFYGISVRADQAWNNNNHSYLEYRYNNFWQLDGNPFGLSNILEGSYQLRLNQGLTASHAWVISPKLLLNVTGNATIYRNPTESPSQGLDPTKYGFSSQLAGQAVTEGIPALNSVFTGSNFTGIGDSSDSWSYNYVYEGKGYLQQIWRNHTFHYGAESLVQQEATGDHNSGVGSYSFSGKWTVQNPSASSTPQGYGSNLADFMMGMPASGNENNDASGYYSQPFIGFYAQDDWRTTPKLTLNLGLRWDYQMPLTERHNKYWTRYDPYYNLTAITNYIQPNYAALVGGSGSNAGIQLDQQYGATPGNFIAQGAILYAGVNGTNRSIIDPQPNYWQPRLGFAYQLRPTTVLRGGYGRFTEANYVANHANQTGYSSSTTFDATNDNYTTQASTLANPYPSGLVAQTGNSLGVYTNPGSVTSFYTSDIKRQYTDDMSLHLQQEFFKDFLVEIGGVYEHTVGIVVGYPVDNVTPTQYHAAFDPTFSANGTPAVTLPGDVQVANPFKGAPYITNSRETASTLEAYWLLYPNPIVTGITKNTYDGKSDHYALQGKVNRHLKNGFALDYAFSWGKQMDSTGYVTNSIFADKILRQLSSSDVRFQNVVSTSYILPFGRGKMFLSSSNRVLDGAVGGWELSGMYVMYSGTPLSLPTDSVFFEGGDPGLGSKKSLTQWFDTSKFYALPTESTTVAQLAAYPSWTGVESLPGASWTPPSGSAQKNGVYNDFHSWSANYPTQYGDVRNPFFQTFNLGLRKSVTVWRETKLQLRMDAFNALNHPIFGNINTTASAAYFGYVNGSNTLSQTNLPRTIQLEGKFNF
jgi:hypothetical protein